MADKSRIEWTDATWNPIRGCSRVSEGCRHCYAERMASRFAGPGQPYEGLVRDGRWTGEVRFVAEHLTDPLRWKRPRRVFVNSMSDLFHPAVSDEEIMAVFSVMARCRHHAFQVLTKRPERVAQWLEWAWQGGQGRGVGGSRIAFYGDHAIFQQDRAPWPLPNVWLGFSAENQATFDERWSHARKWAAAGWHTWLSLEPLLGPVDLEGAFCHHDQNGEPCDPRCRPNGDPLLEWVVLGGESGPDARPLHPDWARSARDQCAEAGTPFLFKQWGRWVDVGLAHDLAERGRRMSANERVVNLAGGHGFHGEEPRVMRPVRDAGRTLDGVIHDEYPEGMIHG